MSLLDAAKALLSCVGWTAGRQAFVDADAVRALYDAVEAEEGARLRERLAAEGPLMAGEVGAALDEARAVLAEVGARAESESTAADSVVEVIAEPAQSAEVEVEAVE